MDLSPDFRDLLEAFGRAKAEYVIVGGYAVAFHGRPRATKDIDLLVAGDSANLVRVAEALTAFGAPRSVTDSVREMKEEEVVYFGHPPMRVDILRSVDGVSTEAILANALSSTLDGVDVRVIGLAELLANKRAAGRPRDLEDVRELEGILTRKG